jgi:hypothetical protein
LWCGERERQENFKEKPQEPFLCCELGIVFMPGTVINRDQYDELRDQKPRGQYVVEIDRNTFIDPWTHPSYARKANMASQENMKGNNAVIKLVNQKVYVVTKRNLKTGEEVLVNYGNKYWKKPK